MKRFFRLSSFQDGVLKSSRCSGTHEAFSFFVPLVSSQGPVRLHVTQVKTLCATRPEAVASRHLCSALTPLVLGSFADKEAACHVAMWDMVLCFARATPGAWSSCNLHKAVLPRLWAFLRHGCHGSSATSFPCVVILLANLPAAAVRALARGGGPGLG